MLMTVGSDEYEVDARVSLSAKEFVTHRVGLRIPPDDGTSLSDRLSACASQAGIGIDDLSIVIVVTNAWLKVAQTVRTLGVTELIDAKGSVELADATDRPIALRTPFGGAEVSAYFCLNKELTRQPLRTWREWTWLARSSFRIVTSLGTVGFTPLPLTPDQRVKLELPPETMRYAEVDNPCASLSQADGVKLWIDAGVLALLNNHPSTSAALTFQRQLFLDAMNGLATKAVSSSDFTGSTAAELDDTLIGGLLDLVGGVAPTDPEGTRLKKRKQMKSELENFPTRFVGRIEALVPGLANDLQKSLSGVAS